MPIKDEKEWFAQAEYDMRTAEINFKTGRYIHAVFM
jgi:HEPN domain-containing protein